MKIFLQVDVSLSAALGTFISNVPVLGGIFNLLGLTGLLNAVGGGLTGVLSRLGLSNLKLQWSTELALELGLTVTTAGQTLDNSGIFGSKLTITSTNGLPVSSEVLNEFLGTVYINNAALGIDLKVAPTYTLTVTDKNGLSDTDSVTSLLGADVLGSSSAANSSIIKGTSANDVNLDQSSATSSVRIYGLDGNDTIKGSKYADIIRGGTGTDTIDGGAGNDLIIGGQGNDILTGGLGRDLFRWEAEDQGTVASKATDTIKDFDIRSVAQGGDALDLSSLLSGASRVGTNSVNIAQYLYFVETGTSTEIHISSTGNTATGVDQVIVLEGVKGFIGQFASKDELISYLLKSGKLIIGEKTLDQAAYDAIKGDGQLNIDIEIQDGDSDKASHKLDVTVGNLGDANKYLPDFDPNNVAPEVSVKLNELLGLIGADALGLLDLSRQAYSVIDVNHNLQRVELVYQPVVNVGLTRATYHVSAKLAAELGLKVEYVTKGGLLNLLGYSNTLIITSLDGKAISNLAINELLAAVELRAENGDLLTGNLLTTNVLNSMSLTAIDTQGESASASGDRLVDVNLA